MFGSQARDQHFLSWNPWNFGGEPLGATSNMGQLNPLAWPFLFLPGWFAPAMVKLAGMASALGFTYLFCRRLGTDRVPAVLGAVVYAGSGFIIMWNNWPQADVASLIPALFWATERFLQKRTASSAVPIALALAALLLAMFPAVVGYTVTVLAGYVAFRLGTALWTARRHPSYASAVEPPSAAPAPVVAEPAVVGSAAGEPVAAAGAPDAVSALVGAPRAVDPATRPVPVEAPDPGGLGWKQTLVAGIGAGAALAAGALLVAVVLLPFGARLSSSALDREQTPDSNLGAATLVTAAAPGVFGLSSDGVNYNGPSRNQVESISYIGVVGLLLAVGAVALPRVRRAPPGATMGLAVTTVFMGIATYGGGPVLEFLQRFPVYDTNFIGRARSILGLTIAALAALGLQALIERGKLERVRSLRPLDVVRLVGVAAVAGWFTVWVYRTGRDFAEGHDRAKAFADSLPSAQVIGLVALAVIALLLVGRGPGRHLLATGLVVLAAVQGLILSVPLLPNESRDTLYPETASLVFLREHQGSDRVVPEKYTLFANATMLQGIRSITGHGFHAPTWKDMLNVASPGAFSSSPTLAQLSGDPLYVASPIYDRMGARWFAGMPNSDPFGTRETLTLDRADCGQMADARVVSTYADMSYGLWGVPYLPGQEAPTPPGSATSGTVEAAPVSPPAGTAAAAPAPSTGASGTGASASGPAGLAGIVPEGNVVARLRVPGENGLNGIVVRLCQTVILPQGSAFHVTAVAGNVTATGILPIRGGVTYRDLALPVAGGDLAGDAPIDVTVTLQNPDGGGAHLAAGPGGGIAADLIRPGDDGLRLAYAGDLRIYERMNALPRVHWAGRSEVVRDAPERVDMLASGKVPDDTVVLSSGEPGGSGLGGTVSVDDATNHTSIDVDAEGDGYVVIADGIQNDWVATLDGKPAELVDADHAGVAVEVPAGRHRIEVNYRPRGQKAGAFLSGVTALGLLVVGLVSLALQFRRRRRAAAAPVGGPGPDGDGDGPGASAAADLGERVTVIAPPTPASPPPPLTVPAPPPDGPTAAPTGPSPPPAPVLPAPDAPAPDGSSPTGPSPDGPSAVPTGAVAAPALVDPSPDASSPTALRPAARAPSPRPGGPHPGRPDRIPAARRPVPRRPAPRRPGSGPRRPVPRRLVPRRPGSGPRRPVPRRLVPHAPRRQPERRPHGRRPGSRPRGPVPRRLVPHGPGGPRPRRPDRIPARRTGPRHPAARRPLPGRPAARRPGIGRSDDGARGLGAWGSGTHDPDDGRARRRPGQRRLRA